ncbi:MAG TPA: hypothetical protein VGN20_06795 [Mucilaginibacter sp.]|jgi:hypothetical protein
MKNLLYSSALLCFILFAASCTKDAAIQPQVLNSSAPSNCGSAPMVNYVLSNSTNDGSYEIAFDGQQNYTFHIPANGTTTVSVKPGTYSIYVYSPGNYTNHTFYLNGLGGGEESGARYDSVSISGCSIAQSLRIEQ